MRFSVERDDASLELRVLELEDTAAAMTAAIEVMAEVLAGLNRVTAHFAETLAALVPGARRGDHPPANDDPDEDGRC